MTLIKDVINMKKKGYKGTLWDALKQKSDTDDGCD